MRLFSRDASTDLRSLIGALAVPTLTAAFLYPAGSNEVAYPLTVVASAIFSFCGVFFLGLPAYYFLPAKGWTAFWIAPLAGFVIATVTWFGIFFLFALALKGDLGHALSALTNIRGALWPIGPIGAAVGALVWLIARPDRTSNEPT